MSDIPRFTAVGLPGLYPDALKAAMTHELMPFDQASPGDLLAITQDYRTQNSTAAYPATSFMMQTEDGPRCIDWVNLPAERQDGTAVLAAHLHSAGFLQHPTFVYQIDLLSSDDGDPAFSQFVMTADGGLLMVENHEDSIFEGAYHGEDIDTDVLQAAMVLIVPRAIDSAHDRLVTAQALAPHLAFFSILANVRDPDTDAQIPVGMPDF